MEANGYSLKMKFNIETFCAESTYLDIKLDRALTFRRHLEALRKKLRTRVGLLEAIDGVNLGCWCHSIVHSYSGRGAFCCRVLILVWCRSAHIRLINKPINDALRIVTGCLRPTPIDNLFVLAGILPTELRSQRAVLSLARRAQGP